MGFSLHSLNPSHLVGNLTGANAARDQAEEARAQQNLYINQALSKLSPEHIQALAQMFQSKYMQLLAPHMLSAQRSLGVGSARTGLTDSGLSKDLAAGIPGTFSQQALAQALQAAMGTASQEAGILGGQKIITNPARTGETDIADAAMQFFTGLYSGGMGKASTGSLGQMGKVY